MWREQKSVTFLVYNLVWGHSSLLRGMKYSSIFPLSHFFVFVTVNHSSDKRLKILRTYFESTFSRKCGWFTSFGRRCHKLKVRDMFQIHFLCFYNILGSRYNVSKFVLNVRHSVALFPTGGSVVFKQYQTKLRVLKVTPSSPLIKHSEWVFPAQQWYRSQITCW